MSEENSVNVEADEIAKKLIETLVEGFKAKEKRDPTPEEVGELMAELSEERIAALLSGEDADEPEKEDNKPEAEAEQAEEPKIDNKENVQKKSSKDDENIVKEVKDDENITGKKRDAEEVEEVASFKWPKAAA